MASTFQSSASDISGLAGSGTVSITVLVRDDYGAISCSSLSATFRTVTEILDDDALDLTAQQITDNLDSVINDTSFGQDNAAAVSVASVAEDLYTSGNIVISTMQVCVKNHASHNNQWCRVS